MMVLKFKLLNSFLFRINHSLPCRDLNPGPPGTKQIEYQCATMLRLDLHVHILSCIYLINFSDLFVGCIFLPTLCVLRGYVFRPALGWLNIHCYILSQYQLGEKYLRCPGQNQSMTQAPNLSV